jgi:hypothetical protein
MRIFNTKRSFISQALLGGFVPKGTECVSFGYKQFMPKASWDSLVSLGDLQGKMWKHLGESVGIVRFRLEMNVDEDSVSTVNLISIDRWRNGVQRMEILHSWEVKPDYSETVHQLKLRDVQRDIWELPSFLRKKVTVDLGYSAKYRSQVSLDTCEDIYTEDS